MGPREGTSQALRVASPHPLLPVREQITHRDLSSVRARQPEGCAGTTAGGCTELGKASEDGTGTGVRSASCQGPGPLQGREGRIRSPCTQTPSTHQRPSPPATHCRMNWMASSYFIPLSMRASATRTGALGGWQGQVTQAQAPTPSPTPSPSGPGVAQASPVALPPHGRHRLRLRLLCGPRWAGPPLCLRLLVYKRVGGRAEGERAKCWAQVCPWMRV